MDIVYVLKSENFTDNELKYSLRSLEKYGFNYNRIFLIGGKPSSLNYDKISYLYFPDISNVCEFSVYMKIVFLCCKSDVSENFILFNDDYYLLKPINLSCIPYYYKRQEISLIYRHQNTFNEMAILTRKFLLKHNKNIFDFKPHYPIIYNKLKILELTSLYKQSFKISPLGLSLRDLYCNWFNVENKVYKDDNKIINSDNFNFNSIDVDLISGSNNPSDKENMFLNNKFF